MKTQFPLLEPLEARIAPATLLTFQDIDGDTVKLMSDKPLTASVDYNAAGNPAKITLSGAGLDGADFSTVVTKSATGDGLVNIGQISAMGLDLGDVTVTGDLGKIVCGNGNDPQLGLKSLKVRSMGLYGTATQGPGSDLASLITGSMGSLTVARDLLGAGFSVGGNVGAVKVGGDWRGGDAIGSGRLSAAAIASVVIGGDLVAGAGDESGKIIASGNLGKVTIAGSVSGATDNFADVKGQIYAGGDAGPISIGKNLIGGSSLQKAIEVKGDAGAITIGGSILGGTGESSGSIEVGGNAGAIKIGHDVQGGAGDFSAQIAIAGQVASFTVGRDLRGGTGSDLDGTALRQISVGSSLGPVRIGGDIVGGTGYGTGVIEIGDTPSFTVGGSIVGGGATFPAVGALSGGSAAVGHATTVTIGGSLVGSMFNGGSLTALSIGKLTIKGSIVGASSIDKLTATHALVEVYGDLGAAIVGGGIVGPGMGNAVGNATFHVAGHTGSLEIKGSVAGGAANQSGAIALDGNAGLVKIGGSLDLGAGQDSGALLVGGHLTSLQIGASLNASVNAASFGAVKIGGDVLGTLAALAGSFNSITVGGSLEAAAYGGNIFATLSLGTVKIAGNIHGSTGPGSPNLMARSAGSIAIGGDVVGQGGKFPVLQFGEGTGAIAIGGDLRGPNGGDTQLNFDAGPTPAQGFASLTVKGSVSNVAILSGVDPNLQQVSQEDSTVGAVKVGGNWIASTLAVGLGRGADMLFGTGDDGPLKAGQISRIASITIAGQVLGTATAGDHFGFVARQIGAVKIGGVTYTPGANPIELAPLSNDVTIRVL